MTLDVMTPDPPELNTTGNGSEYDDTGPGGEEYHRADLASFFEDGAWEEAFDEWAARTDLTEDEYAIVDDLDMLQEFDFFWDEFATRVGYHAPGLAEDWSEREIHPELQSWNTVSSINAAVAELGGIVSEVLQSDYVDWDEEPDVPDDLPSFE